MRNRPNRCHRFGVAADPANIARMAGKVCNVLFLCAGSSARSILGEALINGLDRGRFAGFGAGSHHGKDVHPMAIETLRSNDLPVDGLRSKR
jgi:arsenate reductase